MAPKTITYRQAMREAIKEALQRDDRVFLMGEDVGYYGGAFGVSKGLVEEFGEKRVRDTPLSESGFVGAGIGAALGGMRPIIEVMTVNFSMLAMDQIVNTAGTLLHMSGGQFNVPVVIRMATGAGRQLAAQHSLSLENWYAHVPGLKVVVPATVDDARGMLWTALQDPDPVVMFEHAGLYNREGELTVDANPVDIDTAAVHRDGDDVTLITYGIHLFTCLEAADRLEDMGVEAEVVELRSLRPLDVETFADSVHKTGRAVVVDDGWKTGGMSAEVGMRLVEEVFFSLDGPIRRVARAEVPMPYAGHLEQAALPQVDDVVEAAETLVHPGRAQD